MIFRRLTHPTARTYCKIATGRSYLCRPRPVAICSYPDKRRVLEILADITAVSESVSVHHLAYFGIDLTGLVNHLLVVDEIQVQRVLRSAFVSLFYRVLQHGEISVL